MVTVAGQRGKLRPIRATRHVMFLDTNFSAIETRLRQIRLASRYETNLFWCHQMFLEGWEPTEKHIVDDDADDVEDTRDLGYE